MKTSNVHHHIIVIIMGVECNLSSDKPDKVESQYQLHEATFYVLNQMRFNVYLENL